MKISYRRTGGFVGMVVNFEVDTETLPPEETAAVEELVAEVDFFNLPSKIESETSGADRFQYILTVETDEQQHTVEVGDADLPDDLWPLISKLRTLSRSS